MKNEVQIKITKGLLWDAQRTVQNGFLVKISSPKERFRTVSVNLPPGNGSERFRTIWFFLDFSTKNGSERFPGTFLGAVFSYMFFQYQDFSVESLAVKTFKLYFYVKDILVT